MAHDALLRARRMAETVPQGVTIFQFLTGEGKPALIEAAGEGRVPVTAVSQALIDLVGPKTASSNSIKQLVGLTAKGVLNEAGFDLVARGIRIAGDPLFGSGSTYSRRAGSPKERSVLLQRLLDALDDEEAMWAAKYLRRRVQLK